MLEVVLLVMLQAAPGNSAAPADCQDDDRRLLAAAQEALDRGDDAAARQALDTRDAPDACPRIDLSRISLRSWRAARELAPKGGAPELLGPVTVLLEQLNALGLAHADLRLEIEYAHIAVRAAIAAAQDERPELGLLLTHARDLAERLAARNRHAEWPRTYNMLAGELWFEVDRYEDSRAAYERAVRGEPTAAALVGLARSLSRLRRMDEACATYRRVRDAAPALLAASAHDLGRCR